jgi:hypothetical protein
MANIASTPPESSPPVADAAPAADRRDRGIAAVGALFLVIGIPVGWLSGGDNSTGDVVGCIDVTLVCLAVLAWMVLWLLPRERAAAPARTERTALILGVLALIACVVFWTGLPIPIGAGALALGLTVRESPAGRVKGTAAAALGALAMVASFVALLIG